MNPTPNQQDPRETLLNAAGQVFAEKGFEDATIRQICKKAGLNVAAVNYYFRDKKALYLEAVKLANCSGAQTPQIDALPDAPPEQLLEAFVRQMMEMMLDDGRPSWHIELMMREMGRPTDACVELVRSFIGPKFEMLLQILDQLLPADVPKFDRNLHAFSIISQCLLYRYHRPVGRLLVGEEAYAALDVDRLTRHITDFSLAGLRSASRAAGSKVAAKSPPGKETNR
jgi:TetR/AcrR family transcriptional regulator, regulator of cefoperazone and chloramphenicol sensitivity